MDLITTRVVIWTLSVIDDSHDRWLGIFAWVWIVAIKLVLLGDDLGQQTRQIAKGFGKAIDSVQELLGC